MTDIDWPAWSRDGQRLLALMPGLRRPALTRGEVLALGDGWSRHWLDPDYREARDAAFSALFAHNPNTIQDDAFGVTRKRAAASGEWRGDLLRRACHAATDAAIGRFTADWTGPACTAILARVWHEVMEAPGERPAEPVVGPAAPHPDPGSVSSFLDLCLGIGWDEVYARSTSSSPSYDAALRRCREATWAAGRDAAAREAAGRVFGIPTPGGCYPDEMTMLVDAFYEDLGHAVEAVVARDLLDPTDFDILLASWRAHFGDPWPHHGGVADDNGSIAEQEARSLLGSPVEQTCGAACDRLAYAMTEFGFRCREHLDLDPYRTFVWATAYRGRWMGSGIHPLVDPANPRPEDERFLNRA